MSGLYRFALNQSSLCKRVVQGRSMVSQQFMRFLSTDGRSAAEARLRKRQVSVDEAMGLLPDEKDIRPFSHPGNISLDTDKLSMLPEENREDTLQPSERRMQIIDAAKKATNPISQTLLSLAVMPAEVKDDGVVSQAKDKVLKELQDAPFWDEADTPATKLGAVDTVTASRAVFQEGNIAAAKNYLGQKDEAGMAKIQQLRKEAAEPMPDFSQDFPELSTQDFTNINSLASSLLNSVKVEATAKQPYDTASKVVKSRLEALPVDELDFFTLIGTPREEDRTSLGYLRYLRVISVKGTLNQALKVWTKLKQRGDLLSISYFNEMIACCKCPITSYQDTKEIVDYIMLNPPNIEKATVYPETSEHLKSYNMNPPVAPSTETPYGAPQGFVSIAPNYKTYGASTRRVRFNAHVELAFYLFEQAKQSGIVPDVKLYSVLIGVCAEHKHVERAFSAFELMKRQANGEAIDPTYTPTLKNRQMMEPYRVTKNLKLKPDNVIATQLMKACWKSGKYFEAEEVFHHFWSQLGVQPDAPMYNMMIRIAASTSHVEKAFKYFEQLQHFGGYPSLITYTSLIHACIQPGRPEFYPKAFEVFHECVAAGFRPNEYTLNTLLHACSEQADLQNGLDLWRLMCTDFVHLRTEVSFNTMMRLLGRTMEAERLPGFGGVVQVKGSRTLYSNANTKEEKEKVFRITREERISMAEALYSEYLLATENKDITHGGSGVRRRKLNMNSHFLAELITVYTKAVVGILRYDRKEREEGREDPNLRITEKMITQMVQRSWNRVAKLKEAHPDVFDLNEHMYTSLIEMYGASDMLEQAMVHYDYMTTQLKIPVSMKVYTAMLTWAKRNRHQGAAFVIFEKMKEQGYVASQDEIQMFERMHRAAAKMPQDTTFPSFDHRRKDEEMRWQNVRRRNPKTGQKYQHPLDFDVSYKEF